MRGLASIQCIPAIAEEASGPSYSVLRLSESLIASGHTATLAALDWAPIPHPPAFIKTFPLGLGPRRLGRSPRMKRWLDEQARSGNINVLHSHGMWQMNALYPAWAARKANIDLVVSPRGTMSRYAMQHGSVLKKTFWTVLQKPAIRGASCFHATGHGEYEDIRRMGFRQPVAIIPNGIDIPVWIPKRSSDQRTLLFLGRIHRIKGLDMLLPAWNAVQHRFPNWCLVIAGGDEGYYGKSGYLNELQAMAVELKLERISFVGELRGSAKLDAYRDADLFVLPTYSENFGIVVAEAMATGTPAIVSRGAPWSGLPGHGAGWWIDANVESLVACLEEALSSPLDKLRKMGIAGREWMKAEYGWPGIGAMMACTYEWLTGNGAVPPWVRVN
jgi:glycosyltransferase involved in cell wall biosynthesis